MVAQNVTQTMAHAFGADRPGTSRTSSRAVSTTMAFCNLVAVTILALSLLTYLLFA